MRERFPSSNLHTVHFLPATLDSIVLDTYLSVLPSPGLSNRTPPQPTKQYSWSVPARHTLPTHCRAPQSLLSCLAFCKVSKVALLAHAPPGQHLTCPLCPAPASLAQLCSCCCRPDVVVLYFDFFWSTPSFFYFYYFFESTIEHEHCRRSLLSL